MVLRPLRSALKPFNTHLAVDYPTYIMVICKQYKIKAFASLWWKFWTQNQKIMKEELAVVMTENNSSPLNIINHNKVRYLSFPTLQVSDPYTVCFFYLVSFFPFCKTVVFSKYIERNVKLSHWCVFLYQFIKSITLTLTLINMCEWLRILSYLWFFMVYF